MLSQTRTYIRTYIHTYIHTCTRIHIYVHACMHACIHTYIHTYHTVAYMHAAADTCGQQDSLASEVAWLKWKDANPPRQAGEVTYGPTIFGDDMGVLIRVPYRVRHTVHASSPYNTGPFVEARVLWARGPCSSWRWCLFILMITCAHVQALRMEVENEGKEHAHQVQYLEVSVHKIQSSL